MVNTIFIQKKNGWVESPKLINNATAAGTQIRGVILLVLCPEALRSIVVHLKEKSSKICQVFPMRFSLDFRGNCPAIFGDRGFAVKSGTNPTKLLVFAIAILHFVGGYADLNSPRLNYYDIQFISVCLGWFLQFPLQVWLFFGMIILNPHVWRCLVSTSML